MVRIAARTITFNCLRGIPFSYHSYPVKDPLVSRYMAEPGPQKYFRQLVYYIISLIVTFNNLCEDQFVFFYSLMHSMMNEANEVAQTISDELFIIHDLLQCGMDCVVSAITSTFIRSLLQNMCFPAILNSISKTQLVSTNVCFSFRVLIVVPNQIPNRLVRAAVDPPSVTNHILFHTSRWSPS